MGTFPAKALMASTEIPASAGVPGPGEIISLIGFIFSSSNTVISSFRIILDELTYHLVDVVRERVVIIYNRCAALACHL